MAEASDAFEWLRKLGEELRDRLPAVNLWTRYYEGNQNIPSGPAQFQDAFERFQKKARTNLCLLCSESMVHRTSAIGFRDPNWKSNEIDPVWSLWQRARLDSRQSGLWRKSYSRGAGYLIVGADPKNNTVPRVTIEGPESVIVATDPGDRSVRLAALRLWHDGFAKKWFATVYLPGKNGSAGKRYHLQTKNNFKTASATGFTERAWELRTDLPENPARSLPVVPVIPFLNGDEGELPRAEFDVGMDIQDRLNLTILNRLTAERYAAHRQRGLTNYEAEEDPITGLPISPFNPGSQYLWTVPPPENGEPPPQFFDFAQTDTSNILRAAEADMRMFAAVTLTPVYYLPGGDLTNIGADTIGALDSGHIAKAKQRLGQWSEPLEEALQLMADVAGLDRDLSEGEIVWARPESFNPLQVANLMKVQSEAGVPLPMTAEDAGWSPQRVGQLRSELAAQAMRQRAAQPRPEPEQRPGEQ